MADFEDKRISDLERLTGDLTPQSLFETSYNDSQMAEDEFTTRAATVEQVGRTIVNDIEYASELDTVAKTIIDAINEVNEKAGHGGGGSTVTIADNPEGGIDITVDGDTYTVLKKNENIELKRESEVNRVDNFITPEGVSVVRFDGDVGKEALALSTGEDWGLIQVSAWGDGEDKSAVLGSELTGSYLTMDDVTIKAPQLSQVLTHEQRIEALEQGGGGGGSTVSMSDNPDGGVDITVDGSTKTLAKEGELATIKADLSQLGADVSVNTSNINDLSVGLDRVNSQMVTGVNDVLPNSQGIVYLTDATLPAEALDVEARNGIADVKTELSHFFEEVDFEGNYYDHTNHYISASGLLNKSSSWDTYYFNPVDINKIAYVKSYTNTASYLQIAFYSSETPTVDSLISGLSFGAKDGNEKSNVSIPNGCKLIIITNRKTTSTDISIKLEKTIILSINKELNNRIDEVPYYRLANAPYSYEGERINLFNRLDYYRVIATSAEESTQAGCVFGDTLFRFTNANKFYVWDIPTKTLLGTGQLDGNLTPHCNTAVFSKIKYAESDEYPLIYVNAYNNEALPKGTCYVHRVLRSGATFSTQLVQTINIGFTDDEIWTIEGDSRPYGNFAIDNESGHLWAYTLIGTNITRFFKFVLPSTSNASVILNKSDIIEYWDCPRFKLIQDNICINGKIILCHGEGGDAYIRVIDTQQRKDVSVINLPQIGITIEPEILDIYDNSLICGGYSIYKFDL